MGARIIGDPGSALSLGGQVHQPLTMAFVPLVFLALRGLALQPSGSRLVLAALALVGFALDMQRFWLVLPFALPASLATGIGRHGASASSFTRIVLWSGGAGLLCAALLCFPVVPALIERPELLGHPPELLARYQASYSMPHLLALVDRAGALSSALGGIGSATSGVLAGTAYQGIVPLSLVAVGSVAFVPGREWGGDRKRGDARSSGPQCAQRHRDTEGSECPHSHHREPRDGGCAHLEHLGGDGACRSRTGRVQI